MISISQLPTIAYQVLARAIRDDKVEDRMVKEMFKLRQFENESDDHLNMVDIYLILEYIAEEYSIEKYPELWL